MTVSSEMLKSKPIHVLADWLKAAGQARNYMLCCLIRDELKRRKAASTGKAA